MLVTAGIDVGGTKLLAALFGSDGEIMARREAPTDPSAATSSAIRTLEELVREHPGVEPRAVGVGAAAWIDLNGRVVFAPNASFEQADLASAFEEAFGMPVVVENDANAAAWAEAMFGAGRGHHVVVMLTLGTGVGGGIVIGGDLYRGGTGLAGELGHLVIDEDGPQCGCGMRGCIEQYASGTAIGRMAREAIARGDETTLWTLDSDEVTGADVANAANAGDRVALAVLEEAGRQLGSALTTFTNVLDPSVFVIGGGASQAGDPLIVPARRELERRLGGRREVPEVILAGLGPDAGVIGAAGLARRYLEQTTKGDRQ